MKTYAKAIVGTLAAIATWGVTAGADGEYSQVELWGLLGVIAAAVGVYVATNAPDNDAHPVANKADEHLVGEPENDEPIGPDQP